ncbi:hypothetical protein SeMB42_g05381 [Synchytrium endobioticum]|nr:hypothetical protein SeMB42_g05381 [Synchytrium endobioticum]
MQKHRAITVERLKKFMQKGQFDDVNLRSFLWKKSSADAVKLSVYGVPDMKRISFEEAMRGDFSPCDGLGQEFGPSWITFWFHVSIDIPMSWAYEPVILNFDSDCECLVWSPTGVPLQGLTGGQGEDRHVDFRLARQAKGGEHIELYIEMACNGMFGNGEGGGIFAPSPNRYFRLQTVEIAIPNEEAHALLWDMEILLGMSVELPEISPLAADALFTANAICNAVKAGDPSTIAVGRHLALQFFAKRSNFGYEQHKIFATGHCHIDTAWLWPYDETKRKSARSWATQCGLMDDYPEYKFGCSQAQQFQWIETLYPALFERIKSKVKSGNFLPIGGTWVEMDCNLPSGEAMVRQFLYGQRYFESRFDTRCEVFWLPDTFGYCSQLPQIIKGAGLKYFFTQKLSWNNINKFPHTTFWWKGLDETAVLTHFSPMDTYNAQCTVKDVVFGVSNNKDKEYSTASLMLFGNGDGGGGPLAPMIERTRRLQSIAGLPATVKFRDANEFYHELEATSRDLAEWKGELYFEFHRGTYTSQAHVKYHNRKSEFLLRDVEVLGALCVAQSVPDYAYPKQELDRLWKLVLLNQFHDVLPGSSIEMAYEDVMKFYGDVEATGRNLRKNAMDSLKGTVGAVKGSQCISVFNGTSWARGEVLAIDASVFPQDLRPAVHQYSADRSKVLILVDDIPAYGFKCIELNHLPTGFVPVTVSVSARDVFTMSDGDYVTVEGGPQNLTTIENAFVRVTVDAHARIVSFYDITVGRELIPKGALANVFKIFDDQCLYWDAWDVEVYHLEKGWDAGVGSVKVVERGPLRAVLVAEHHLSETSILVQKIILNASSSRLDFKTHVSWNENRKILKVEFPLDIICDYATYETQFGVVQRPTHFNTSWDLAKFEVCGHKFADLSEFGYGVALLNDCKYGYSTHRNVMRLSLLRAPKAPDAHCDIGGHKFTYALYPHRGTFMESDVVQAGYQLNVPLEASPSAAPASKIQQYFTIHSRHVVLDTIKVAEDPRPGVKADLVLRCYEAYGGRAFRVKITSAFAIKSAEFCNLLEELDGTCLERDDAGALLFDIGPFKVVSIRIAIV